MQVTDPVCGRQFEIDRSVAAAEHDGWMYFFCSSDCERRFTSEPARYEEPRLRARAPATWRPSRPGGTHA